MPVSPEENAVETGITGLATGCRESRRTLYVEKICRQTEAQEPFYL